MTPPPAPAGPRSAFRSLLDRLEELEDVEDLKKIRHEPTRPFSDVLAELDLDGNV